MSLTLPPGLPTGVYGLTIEAKGKTVFEKKSGFVIVPSQWLGGVKLTSPLNPGGQSRLDISGRDLNAAFLSTLHLEVDEPGLKLSPLRLRDDRSIEADLSVDANVRSGDYLIHVYRDTKEVHMPRGNIIKIGS